MVLSALSACGLVLPVEEPTELRAVTPPPPTPAVVSPPQAAAY